MFRTALAGVLTVAAVVSVGCKDSNSPPQTFESTDFYTGEKWHTSSNSVALSGVAGGLQFAVHCKYGTPNFTIRGWHFPAPPKAVNVSWDGADPLLAFTRFHSLRGEIQLAGAGANLSEFRRAQSVRLSFTHGGKSRKFRFALNGSAAALSAARCPRAERQQQRVAVRQDTASPSPVVIHSICDIPRIHPNAVARKGRIYSGWYFSETSRGPVMREDPSEMLQILLNQTGLREVSIQTVAALAGCP